jgi:galactose mutarotase-like enzyme
MSSQLKDGLLTHAPAAYAHTTETIELTADTFAHDALIFKKYTPASWKLTRADGKTVEITQDGFTHSALWSKPQAPFVCIEHWSGHADTPDAPTELSEKPTLTHLKDGHMQYTTAMRFM